ncbi:Protein of unknown function [Roseivivax lentus]|uniref:Pvc16 N-terminal domain-containing protein n=1 Tax=Roseivivax lentus TaxID=633194 RepID=A0A1N7NUD9_9RHOB|nr:DUF4255 domain-containing protein [Roseivivax lentus]SIT01954.1 Protein of unknown function [Roseivivax lentus]
MANALAIAGVTAVLRDLLNEGLINNNVDQIGQFTVSSRPVDALEPEDDADQINRLNIYMWNATRNPAWSNERLPARSADGARIDGPFLALDLHYVLTATGADELSSEILLGYGMQLLHETPVLTREAIREALGGTAPVDADILPPARRFLAATDLADQFEQIRITPASLDPDPQRRVEVLSNIWSSFSSALRASAFYQVNCVLIENRTPVRSSLPVLSIGGRVAPLRAPRVTRIRALPGGAGSLPDPVAPILAGGVVAMEGTALVSENMRVMLGLRELAVAAADLRNTRIDVALPADVPAGFAALSVEHLFDPGNGDIRVWEMSNALAFPIAPVMTTATPSGSVTNGTFTGTVTVDLAHPVLTDQVAALLFNPVPGAPEPAFSVRCRRVAATGTQVVADLAGVPAAVYLIRVEIDGAASQLGLGPSGFDSPVVDLGP